MPWGFPLSFSVSKVLRTVMRSLVFVALLIATSLAHAQLNYRPGQEFRTLNSDLYEVSIQKNGRVDLELPSGLAVFGNAFPMIWIEGEDGPTPLKLDGRLTGREAVNDRMGQGNGMLFKKGGSEWSIRSYPTKPFLLVQCAFVNTSKKPVRVRALLPWCVGEPNTGQFTLGERTERVVTLPAQSDWNFPLRAESLQIENAASYWSLAAYCPANGRSLIAGFLTNAHGRSYLQFEKQLKDEPFVYGLFRASCIYDPPVELQPGERIESEVLYLAITEPSPLEGLQHYAQTLASANDVSRKRPFAPDGWPGAPTTTPVWSLENDDQAVGCVQAMALQAKRFHFASYLFAPYPRAVYLGAGATYDRWPQFRDRLLTEDQATAWLTAAALCGGKVEIGDAPGDLSEAQQRKLAKVIPAIGQTAQPVDLFETETPRIWVLPLKTTFGAWQIVGVFNWDAQNPLEVTLDFDRIGLSREGYFTVFDFWQERYHGTAMGQLNLTVQPGAVRLLGFRRYESRPMLLASDRHITQGALDHTRVEWDPERLTLSGSFEAIAGTECNLHVLAPEPYALERATSSATEIQPSEEERIVRLHLICDKAGPTDWSLTFTQSAKAN